MLDTQTKMPTARYLFVGLLFVLISAIFLRMVWGFVLAVVMAAIFTGLSQPLYDRVMRRVGGRKALAAILP